MAFVGLEEDTICAFCLMTSAGVRMAQDTSSARLDADAWTRAMGRMSLPLVLVFHVVNSDFVRSYVVKKAPAAAPPAVSLLLRDPFFLILLRCCCCWIGMGR